MADFPDLPSWDLPGEDSRPRYYNRSGEPISLWEWAHLLEPKLNPMANDYRRVASTKFETGTWVSTVWLGLDHGFPWDGEEPYRPLIFETMVFIDDRSDDYCERYSTEEEALAGHERACEYVRAKLAEIERLIHPAGSEKEVGDDGVGPGS